jgi:hypothetical protein
MSQEFVVDVKRKKQADDTDLWTAVTNGQRFEAASEEELREQVRLYLLGVVANGANKSIDDYNVTLRRTWWVRIKESVNTDDEPIYSLFD